MIPQKKKWADDFLETFPECSLLIPVLRTTIKKISHRACLKAHLHPKVIVAVCFCFSNDDLSKYVMGLAKGTQANHGGNKMSDVR